MLYQLIYTRSNSSFSSNLDLNLSLDLFTIIPQVSVNLLVLGSLEYISPPYPVHFLPPYGKCFILLNALVKNLFLFLIVIKLEDVVGFKPTNTGFADQRVRSLRHTSIEYNRYTLIDLLSI